MCQQVMNGAVYVNENGSPGALSPSGHLDKAIRIRQFHLLSSDPPPTQARWSNRRSTGRKAIDGPATECRVGAYGRV